jgi:hypothetical protein
MLELAGRHEARGGGCANKRICNSRSWRIQASAIVYILYFCSRSPSRLSFPKSLGDKPNIIICGAAAYSNIRARFTQGI